MKVLIKTSLIFFIVAGFSVSCGDNFLNKVDNTSINSGSFYQSENDAIASVNAVYAPLQNISLWGRRFHFLLDFPADEVDPTGNTQGPPQELLQHTFGPVGNEHIEWPWRMFYRIIAKANVTIEAVGAMDEKLISAKVRGEVIGQAKFLRALSYYYINVLWNGGPLRTEENDDQVSVGRAAPAEIWAQVEADLKDAIAALPTTWGEADLGRATKGAAQAQLGKAYLYQKKYAEAEAEFMNVINSGAYYLMGSSQDPAGAATTVVGAIAAMRKNHDFGVKNIGETVFEVQFASGLGGLSWNSGSSTGRQESTIRPHEYGVDGFSFYNCKPSADLIAEYEGNGGTGIGDRDPRVEAFFFTQNDTLGNGTPYNNIFVNSGYAWKKYQSSDFVSTGNDNDCNHDVIRYADVILMAAETKIFQNKIDEGVDLINQIRRRADPTGNILPNVQKGISQQDAIDALVHERRVELCGEQVRRIDLVRWGIAVGNIPNFQTGKHEFFPIPQFEIDANEEMTLGDQNSGY